VSILKSLGYPNRVVSILTPILAPLGGWFATAIAKAVPGIPESSLNEIFIGGVALVLAPAAQFIYGRMKWDLQQNQLQALGAGRSQIAPPAADEFAALGLAQPAVAVPEPESEDGAAVAPDDSAVVEDSGEVADSEDEFAAAVADAGGAEVEDEEDTDFVDDEADDTGADDEPAASDDGGDIDDELDGFDELNEDDDLAPQPTVTGS
jgi:hypothetical protein